MKKIAMIPMLLGSTRIPDKNLLLVDGKPMVFYVVEACRQAGVFDAIYLNSEHLLFKKITDMLDVEFYHRKPARGGSACTMRNKSRRCEGDRCQTHDHFLLDFMEFSGPCHLTMVHTTSPLLKPETIARFTKLLEAQTFDSLFSIEERYTETFFGEGPLNFSAAWKHPTQSLDPVRLISWALTGWNTSSFVEAFRRDDPKEPGPTFCGKVGFFPLSRMEALDADTWDELKIIEACLNYSREKREPGEFVFHEKIRGIESDLRSLILRDGVTRYEDDGANALHSCLDKIKRRMGSAPWLYVLAYTSTDQAALICQNPGEGARKHCHVTHDEWWLVLEGEFEWRLEDRVVKVKEGEVIFLNKGQVHNIVCTGEKPGIRLAMGGRDMEHIYVE